MSRITFPPDFLWGAATAAYQIEGAHDRDGKGESIWDRFTHTPGKVKDGATGDVACDHYRRFAEDVALMRELKLNAYRFSIAWSRIQPEGKGRPNEQGLDFYARLLEALHAAGITPLATLYHWDLPQALQDQGGWPHRDTALRFADYAALVGKHLGDRLPLIATLNEPQIFTTLGYLRGEHAPGIADPIQYFRASHHANLAHGLAIAALREETRNSKLGVVLALNPVYAKSDHEKDVKAARNLDGFMNRWFADPMFLGRYPEDLLALLKPLTPIEPGDLDRIRQPLDFAGLNLYTRIFAKHEPAVPLLETNVDLEHREPGSSYTTYGWEIYPPAMSEMLLRMKAEWPVPAIYITENGAAFPDEIKAGRVDDRDRIDYLAQYLAEVRRAMAEGVPVKGYFVWSLLDNFEWSEGYRQRFGIVHVDFPTQKRTPKASTDWFRRVIENNGFDW